MGFKLDKTKTAHQLFAQLVRETWIDTQSLSDDKIVPVIETLEDVNLSDRDEFVDTVYETPQQANSSPSKKPNTSILVRFKHKDLSPRYLEYHRLEIAEQINIFFKSEVEFAKPRDISVPRDYFYVPSDAGDIDTAAQRKHWFYNTLRGDGFILVGEIEVLQWTLGGEDDLKCPLFNRGVSEENEYYDSLVAKHIDQGKVNGGKDLNANYYSAIFAKPDSLIYRGSWVADYNLLNHFYPDGQSG